MILERLPQNISGFFDEGEQPRSLDAREFKQACHLVAQAEGGTVDGLELKPIGRRYFGATIRTGSDHLSVLCNSIYPYLAFVPPNGFGLDAPELAFVEPNDLAATFASVTKFQPLDTIWLQTDLSSDALAELAHSERRQLGYWKPKRIGDVIFNDWD